jgi:predicted NBD/HSP70 family sugar kinase
MYLTIDIGGSSTKYAVMDDNGVVIQKQRIKRNYDSLEQFQISINRIIKESIYSFELQGIGVSIPGKVDVESGTISRGGALTCLHGFNLKKYIENKFEITTIVENDGKCAVLGEFWKGNLRDTSTSLILVLGTGLGCGIIINGKLFRGSSLNAGELSYLTIKDQAESIKDILGFQLSATQMIENISQINELPTETPGEIVFEYINENNPKSWQNFTNYCKRLAKLIINLQYIYDYEKIAIGGGISEQPILIIQVHEEINKMLKKNPHLYLRPTVVSSLLFNDANLYGALYLIKNCTGGK